MTDFRINDLSSGTARNNYTFWKSNMPSPPDSSVVDMMNRVETTHTFAVERYWIDSLGNKQMINLCELILKSAPGGLISDAARVRVTPPGSSVPRRVMTRARQVGLDDFVFTYLGCHEPYYGASRDPDDDAYDAFPIFGLFIKRELERFPECNASRRDLASSESSPDTESEFLLPNDARVLAAHEVSNNPRHQGDFWHYWGCRRYRNMGSLSERRQYVSQQWEWKMEFHFRERIEKLSFGAILWPIEPMAIGAGTTRFTHLSEESDAFRRHFPEIDVVTYEWDQANSADTFATASEAVTRYFLRYNRYPRSAEDAIEEFKSEL